MRVAYSEKDDQYYIDDGEDILWFDSPLDAEIKLRKMELDARGTQERKQITQWLRTKHKNSLVAQLIAIMIEKEQYK